LSNHKRRDTHEIKYDILKAAIYGNGKTRIMYESGLNLRQLNSYFAELLSRGALEFRSKERKYATTERGQAFVKAYEHYRETADLLLKQEAILSEFFPTSEKRTFVVGSLQAYQPTY